MALLLADLKTELGITGTAQDDYLLANVLVPAVLKATTLSMNPKMTTVSFTTGNQSYDLTDSAIASPVVSSAGIQDLTWDENYSWPYRYKRDFFIKDKTTLYFPDSEIPYTGTMKMKYNGFFSNPTDSGDGDIPDILKPSVVKWSTAEYGLKNLSQGLSTGQGGYTSKSEEGMSVSFGSTEAQKKTLEGQKKDAELELIDLGANGKFDFYSIQVI